MERKYSGVAQLAINDTPEAIMCAKGQWLVIISKWMMLGILVSRFIGKMQPGKVSELE